MMMRENDTILLRTAGLRVGYEHTALVADVNLRVECGEVVALIGPNGAGKTTLLKTCCGMLRPLSGNVWLAGRELDALSGADRAQTVAVLTTEHPTTELMTCADVVAVGRQPYTGRFGVLQESDKARIRESMELMGVGGLASHDFMQVSDGQRQRVLLARTICQGAPLMVLDEPTSYLDIRYQIDVLEALSRLVKERGCSLLVSLHDVALARQVADRLVCIKDGRVYAEGTPAQICRSEVIDELYDLEPGSFDPWTGEIRLGEAGAQSVRPSESSGAAAHGGGCL